MRRPERGLVLADAHVRLEPLTLEHAAELYESCGDPGAFRWVFPGRMESPADMARLVDLAMTEADRSTRVPLLIRTTDGSAVGSTSFLDIEPASRRLEIGATFLAPRVWRTAVNTTTKRLLLGHAFDDLGAGRVALKTDGENRRSQVAIERIGAQYEGTLRQHMVRGDGTIRDTVYYSILAAEWPAVRARLDAALAG
jgi:RimJ/RimL family protein N-acetyltransferase